VGTGAFARSAERSEAQVSACECLTIKPVVASPACDVD